jgi:Fe-S-cluster-containing dehydrogenase component
VSNASGKWALFFDADKCNGCNNCTIAVADEYYRNAFEGYSPPLPKDPRWFQINTVERGSGTSVDVTQVLRTCQHCEDPSCAKAGPAGAIRVRADGIVMVDPVRAKGAREIVDACPHGAMVWNDEHQVPQNWNFDAHLLDQGWRVPRPVQACPTGALSFRRLSDSELAAERAKSSPGPFADAKPGRVLYRGTGALNTVFVAGRVVRSTSAGDFECVSGLDISVERGSGACMSGKTNAFGQFKIDGIAKADLPEEVTLIIGPGAQRIPVAITESVDLGRIVFDGDDPTTR